MLTQDPYGLYESDSSNEGGERIEQNEVAWCSQSIGGDQGKDIVNDNQRKGVDFKSIRHIFFDAFWEPGQDEADEGEWGEREDEGRPFEEKLFIKVERCGVVASIGEILDIEGNGRKKRPVRSEPMSTQENQGECNERKGMKPCLRIFFPEGAEQEEAAVVIEKRITE